MQVAQNKPLNTLLAEVPSLEADTQRRLAADTLDRSRVTKAGTRVDSFSVSEAFGDTLELSTLLAQGPLALVFFRSASCRACNIALPYYHRHLLPQLQAYNTRILALSPQPPERLIGIKLRLGMDFLVACDRDNRLARRFGIACIDAPASRELPRPTVILLDTDGVVRFIDVSPHSLERTEAAPVIAAVRDMTLRHATRRRQLATS